MIKVKVFCGCHKVFNFDFNKQSDYEGFLSVMEPFIDPDCANTEGEIYLTSCIYCRNKY